MGTPGIPWKPEEDIEPILRKRKGVLLHCAKDLKIGLNCLRRYVQKDAYLSELLNDLRQGYLHEGLDRAEDVVFKAMDKIDTDANVALKSAIYFLNNQGKERGYAHPDTGKIEAVALSDLKELLAQDKLKQT